MTSPTSRNGIYGPNTPHWSTQDWERIARGGFRRLLVRTDVSPRMAEAARAKGLSLVHQFPDRWALGPGLIPSGTLVVSGELANERWAPGEPWVLDNEPNLLSRLSRWHAEQWVRYYRALWAYWQWVFPAQEHRLIHPALSPNVIESLELWENVIDFRAEWVWPLGVHCYWQDEAGLKRELDRLALYADVASITGGEIYVLEYANTNPTATEEDKAAQYVRFLTEVPDVVVACYLFILGGTEDWKAFWPSDTILDALAGLPE